MDRVSTAHADIRAWLHLTLVPGVEPKVQRALLEEFRDAEAILAAPHGALVARVGDHVARLIAEGPAPAILDATMRWLDRPGCHLLSLNDPRYPQRLKEISDPPAVLYAQGRLELLQNRAFAIVGSRNATHQGVEDAHAFARMLSESGLTIVSGLALGIDAAAHRGGLAGKGSSIAVMGTGPNILYPRRNVELGRALAADGCLLSEFHVGMPSLAMNFPRRNRLISGLSRGVLVVEAAMRSGSLITAREALDQNRDVFAIPGSIHSTHSKGCHWLIKEGAQLVEEANDILVALGFAAPRAKPADEEAEALEADPILAALGFAPATVDQLAQRTGLDAATLAAQLARLEIEACVAPLPGARFQRIDKRVIE